MKATPSLRAALGMAAATLMVAACGGGGGGGTPVAADPPVAGTDVPASATLSSAGAVAFVRSVAASRDETTLPLTVGGAVLATSDTDEPEPDI